MARWAFLLRLALPLLMGLTWASIIFRPLVLVLIALAIGGTLFLVSRIGGRGRPKARPSARGGKKIVEGSYSLIDEEEPPKS